MCLPECRKQPRCSEFWRSGDRTVDTLACEQLIEFAVGGTRVSYRATRSVEIVVAHTDYREHSLLAWIIAMWIHPIGLGADNRQAQWRAAHRRER